jgi:hypothetical protein
MLSEDDERTFAGLQTVVHVVMTANALLALFEFATKTLIFPYRLDGVAFTTDLRSSALQGHPLANAMVTAIYVLALLSGARSLSMPVRIGLIGLQCAALVAFGGRTAMVTTMCSAAATCFFRASANCAKAASICSVRHSASCSPRCCRSSSSWRHIWLFRRVLERFVSDSGSANARVEMFELFKHLELRDLIVGPDVDLIDSLRRINGLEQGIENPIIRTIALSGRLLHPFADVRLRAVPVRGGAPLPSRHLAADAGLGRPDQHLGKRRVEDDAADQVRGAGLVLYRPARAAFRPVSPPA